MNLKIYHNNKLISKKECKEILKTIKNKPKNRNYTFSDLLKLAERKAVLCWQNNSLDIVFVDEILPAKKGGKFEK